jgi:hypothetical protein
VDFAGCGAGAAGERWEGGAVAAERARAGVAVTVAAGVAAAGVAAAVWGGAAGLGVRVVGGEGVQADGD